MRVTSFEINPFFVDADKLLKPWSDGGPEVYVRVIFFKMIICAIKFM